MCLRMCSLCFLWSVGSAPSGRGIELPLPLPRRLTAGVQLARQCDVLRPHVRRTLVARPSRWSHASIVRVR